MKITLKAKLTDATVSQNENADRNAYPGAEQSVALRKDNHTNKFITGYDLMYGESEEDILNDPKHEKHQLFLEKKLIETALNVKLDGDPNNEFLLHLRLPLCDRSSKAKVFNLTYPMDKLLYRALIAGGFAAPSEEESYVGKYNGCLYYFSAPKVEESTRQEVRKLKNKLGAKLETFEDNKVWLLAISNKLNLSVSPDILTTALYSQIDDYKTELKSKDEVEKLKRLFDTPLQDLELDFIVSMGLKFMIIESTTSGKFIDSQNIGVDSTEIIKNLSLPQYDETYAFLREKVYKKFNI